MAKSIDETVRTVCLAYPQTEAFVSHGSPNFRIAGGRTFATYVVNHHGDGRVALWLAAAPGAQAYHVERDPEQYFVPPYVGPRGWLGVRLDRGLDWKHVAERVREAYLAIAPKRLAAVAGPAPVVAAPAARVPEAALDPFAPVHVRKTLERLRTLCLALPETSEGKSFGNPVWKAGKKTFCQASRYGGRLALLFWVGPEQQDLLSLDERFEVPAYLGHNGWIALDAERGVDWQEVGALVMDSYRHFALNRMLQQLVVAGRDPKTRSSR
jgi:predicted DNA-binding protein (MmcQ/YjbR family)